MALLNKFFPGRRKPFSSSSSNSLSEAFQCHSQSIDIPFNADQVRVLLFRECDFQGRKLLFDSSAIQKTVATETPTPSTNIATDGKPMANGRCGHSSGIPPAAASTGHSKPNTLPQGVGVGKKKYTYGRPQSDHNDLAEMVWGTAAMNFRGTSLKVHWLKRPSRILCSQIFLSPVAASAKPFNGSVSPPINMTQSVNHFDGTGSDISSLDTTSMSSYTGGDSLADGSRGSFQMEQQELRWSSATDSGVNSDSPWNTSVSSYPYPSSTTRSSFGSVYSTDQESFGQRKTSIDSSIQGDALWLGGGASQQGQQHMQKRVQRCLSTSFENHNSLGDYIGVIGETTTASGTTGGSDIGRWRRNSEVIQNERLMSNPEMARRKASGETISIPFYSHGRLNGNGATNGGQGHATRRSKLGIAVCVTLHENLESELKVFFSEHICLFESLLNRLRAIVEGSYTKNPNVSHAMFRAWKVTRQHIQDLLMAPRITFPVWLTLSSSGDSSGYPAAATLADTFISELCMLLTKGDTKDTNFFISTLLTATLTHHLGWVGSVAPIHAAINYPSSEPGDPLLAAVHDQLDRRSQVSKSHPYNALWAQMSDLYGAIGHPPKISRTIVVGRCAGTMDKILNVLTYFIRCGDIRKRVGDSCVLDRQKIDRVMESVDEHLVDLESSSNFRSSSVHYADDEDTELDELQIEVESEYMWRLAQQQERFRGQNNGGMYRTVSHVSSLNQLDNGVALPIEALTNNKPADLVQLLLAKNVMNDIPKVFAYRDSRFVKQELRIGNILMDTGMERGIKREIVKLMVTSPDNELIDVQVGEEVLVAEDNDQMPAAEPQMVTSRSLSALITENSLGSTKEPTKLLWGIEPVKEGMGSDELRHWERGIEMQEEMNFTRPSEGDEPEGGLLRRGGLFTKSAGRRSDHPHLAIRRSKMGRRKSGGSMIDELREEECPDEAQGVQPNDVVFVLGDNEQLVNLKQFQGGGAANPMKSVSRERSPIPGKINATASSSPLSSTPTTSTTKKEHKCCRHKAQKHSGVKFNFEQYPQIAENYMRHKNFNMQGSEILAKAIKMEERLLLRSEERPRQQRSAIPHHLSSSSSEEDVEDDLCECCAGFKASGQLLLQTPSNASELDLEWCNFEGNSKATAPQDVSMKAGTSTSSSSAAMDNRGAVPKREQGTVVAQFVENLLRVVALPMPSIEEMRPDKRRLDKVSLVVEAEARELQDKLTRRNPLTSATKWGMVPSLLLGVTDHYVPDMVLQGIHITQPQQLHWDLNLKQDLTLSARCATLEQIPTENVAVVANVDDWEVRVVSSNVSHLPQENTTNGGCLVSYSTSVVSMLETVHAMWSCGLPAYQCMSFIEAKLQELYMQSETLAKFLMATEFCKIEDVTRALDVSANDIQLLLSVAATHSPQVTRKYGLSFK